MLEIIEACLLGEEKGSLMTFQKFFMRKDFFLKTRAFPRIRLSISGIKKNGFC